MTEQLDLFHIASEENKKEQEAQRQEVKDDIWSLLSKGEFNYKLFNVCPKCRTKPVARRVDSKTRDGIHFFVTCPICGYSVATHYDPYEHWNTCNYYRERDGRV